MNKPLAINVLSYCISMNSDLRMSSEISLVNRIIANTALAQRRCSRKQAQGYPTANRKKADL